MSRVRAEEREKKHKVPAERSEAGKFFEKIKIIASKFIILLLTLQWGLQTV